MWRPDSSLGTLTATGIAWAAGKRRHRGRDRGRTAPSGGASEGGAAETAANTTGLPDHFGRLAALLVAAVVAAYQPVWQAGFVWDDPAHVTRTQLRSVEGLVRIWADLDATQQYYPLTHSMFWVQHRLWGDDPLGYHLVNVALHAVNALLLLVLLSRLRVPGATLAAFVFALHPVMVESVAWVTELKNTLSGLLYLVAALAYLRFDRTRQGRWYAVALGLFLLGLASKTVVATLPGALLVVFWWQRGRLEWRRDAWPLVPFFLLGTVAGLFTALVERHLIGAEGAEFEFSVIERLLIAGRVPWFYLGKLLWPFELSFIYPRWEVRQTAWWQYAYLLATVLALGLAWRYRHRTRAPLATLLFFGGTLLPVLGFVNVYPFIFSLVADHFQYLASLGPITLVAAGCAVLAGRLDRSWTLAMAALLLAGLATLTWRQARLYHDRETLWLDTLAKNPTCWLAHNNLGKLLLESERVAEAIPHFEAAIGVRPHHVEAHTNLGVAKAVSGSPREAIPHFHDALRYNPQFAMAHNNLGLALGKIDQLPEAIGHLQEALRLDPDYPEAHYNLGLALIRDDRPAEAADHFRHAVRQNPAYAKAHHALGQVSLRLGQTAEAGQHYAEAVRLAPDEAGPLNDLAWLRATAADAALRDGQSAVRLAQRAVQLSGRKEAGILDTLAAAYAESGRWAEAVATAEEALALARQTGPPPLAADLQKRRDQFRARQPWREPPAARSP